MSVSLRHAIEAYAAEMEAQGASEAMCDTVAYEIRALLDKHSDGPDEAEPCRAAGGGCIL